MYIDRQVRQPLFLHDSSYQVFDFSQTRFFFFFFPRKIPTKELVLPIAFQEDQMDLGSPSGQIPELSGVELRGEHPGAQRAQLHVPPTGSSHLPRHAWSTPCCLIAYKSTRCVLRTTFPGIPGAFWLHQKLYLRNYCLVWMVNMVFSMAACISQRSAEM